MTRPNTILDINRFFTIGDKDECWRWFGPYHRPSPRNPNGFPYGWIKIKNKIYSAHRLMYSYIYGIDPKELYVLHKCDNPRCVKPSHLFLGTQGDNIRDMISKNRRDIKGERGSAAKITNLQALLIRADKRTCNDIAEEYGVTKGTIAKIKRRATFRNLP